MAKRTHFSAIISTIYLNIIIKYILQHQAGFFILPLIYNIM